jgi:hypothetical protein
MFNHSERSLKEAENKQTTLRDHYIRARSLMKRLQDPQQKLIVKESELSLKKELTLVA